MALPTTFTFFEKLPAILSRINPIIGEMNLQKAAVENLETAVSELTGAGEGPDLTLLFENGLI